MLHLCEKREGEGGGEGREKKIFSPLHLLTTTGASSLERKERGER